MCRSLLVDCVYYLVDLCIDFETEDSSRNWRVVPAIYTPCRSSTQDIARLLDHAPKYGAVCFSCRAFVLLSAPLSMEASATTMKPANTKQLQRTSSSHTLPIPADLFCVVRSVAITEQGLAILNRGDVVRFVPRNNIVSLCELSQWPLPGSAGRVMQLCLHVCACMLRDQSLSSTRLCGANSGGMGTARRALSSFCSCDE